MDLALIKQEINKQIADKETFGVLMSTTFKGLEPSVAKRAMLEGMMRGFEFNDFLEKNIYAIPFSNSYSLVTSIDYARKVGMRSGIVGKSAPQYEEKDGKIISCTMTIKRRVGDYTGDYSATVYFDEYYQKGKTYNGKYTPSMWDKKPRTMIAKVAEMHALRMACPEELSQAYIEEDYAQDVSIVSDELSDELSDEIKAEIDALATVEALRDYYQKNKGKGKDFDKYVTKRKSELQNS